MGHKNDSVWTSEATHVLQALIKLICFLQFWGTNLIEFITELSEVLITSQWGFADIITDRIGEFCQTAIFFGYQSFSNNMKRQIRGQE